MTPDKPRGARRRVAFLNSHPIQYAAPLYASLARSEDIEPIALYLTDFSLRGAVDRQFGREVVWDVDLLEGYQHAFVGRHWPQARPGDFWSLRGDGLWRAIGAGRFDALVLHGHSYLADHVALASARFHRVPVFYKAETHLLLPRSPLKRTLRRPALSALFAQMAGFLAVSSRNRDFYRSFGIPESRIADFPYTVDNDRYIAASTLDLAQRGAMRERLGLSQTTPVVVYASKLMPRKHPDDLLAAMLKLHREGVEAELLVVGTGELEERLRQTAATAPSFPVRFAGFVNQSAMPAVLAACDVFVLPSENEPFGLIVNEAMCAGLPVVVSEEVGCVPDLVHPGVNGATFPARDVDALAAVLRPILANAELRKHMGAASRKIIGGWSYRENLLGLRAALAGLA